MVLPPSFADHHPSFHRHENESINGVQYLVFSSRMEERLTPWRRLSRAFAVSGAGVRSFWMAGRDRHAAAEMNPAGMKSAATRYLPLKKSQIFNKLSQPCQGLFPTFFPRLFTLT
jgi:hypothetical protein